MFDGIDDGSIVGNEVGTNEGIRDGIDDGIIEGNEEPHILTFWMISFIYHPLSTLSSQSSSVIASNFLRRL